MEQQSLETDVVVLANPVFVDCCLCLCQCCSAPQKDAQWQREEPQTAFCSLTEFLQSRLKQLKQKSLRFVACPPLKFSFVPQMPFLRSCGCSSRNYSAILTRNLVCLKVLTEQLNFTEPGASTGILKTRHISFRATFLPF